MVSATWAAFANLFAAFTTIDLFPFLQSSRTGATTPTKASAMFDGAVQVLLPLAATVALFAAVAVIHLHQVAVVGTVKKRMSEVVPFTLCAAAGVLLFFLFVLPAGAAANDDEVGALSRALGGAAVDLLPASAAVVFFLGITLVIAHIRAGGEGGGGAAVADNRRAPVPVDRLKRIAVAAAAALLGQIAIAVYLK